MTIIAWDGVTLAADKRALHGSLYRTTTKIFKVNGELIGYSGDASFCAQLLAWYVKGAIPVDFPPSQRDKDDYAALLVIKPPYSRILKFERTPYPIEFEDEFFAIGSGRDFALAGMRMGLNAPAAVELAYHFDCGCGNGIDTLSFDSISRQEENHGNT